MGDEALRLGNSNRKLDEAATHQGIEKECPMRPGLVVTILPGASWNPRYAKATRNWAMSATDADTPEEAKEQAEEAFRDRYDDPEFVAEALVADMSGLYNAKGNEVQYTTERGIAILADPGNADVRQWIVNQAHQYGQYYTEAVEEDAGN